MRFFSRLEAKVDSGDDLLIIGSKHLLEKHLQSDWLVSLIGETTGEPPSKKQKTSQASTSVLSQVASTLSPSSDNDDMTTTYVPTDGGVKKITIGALRTACSRHNTPTMSHAVTAIVKKTTKKAGLTVVLLLNDKTHALATGCGVARGYPQYNRKASSSFGVPHTGKSAAVIEDDRVSVIFSDCNKEELVLITNTATSVQMACRLVDAPPNELTTDSLVSEAEAVAKKHNIVPVIIRGEQLRDGGFGGIYGVGKAATCPPALVCMSYYPTGTTKDTEGAVVLVGKGIVYDTGGLSIKTKDGMPGMKRDMGGSAALLCAFDAAVASSYVKTPLHVILCIAENAVGPVATRPDDVHLMYSGKSVEINNTDAEGRLVLGDGVAYAVKNLNPYLIVDMATLTGAQGVATGKHFAAIYCNDEEIEKQAISAGKITGDLVHPVPYAPELFRSEFKSAVADMKNSVKNRANAQASCAGQFIGNHLGSFQDTGKWLHVDMAYPSFDGGDERATGYGVALVQGLLKELAK